VRLLETGFACGCGCLVFLPCALAVLCSSIELTPIYGNVRFDFLAVENVRPPEAIEFSDELELSPNDSAVDCSVVYAQQLCCFCDADLIPCLIHVVDTRA
jgi:hypothetical protein